MSALESLKNYISKIKPLDKSWNDKTDEYLKTLAIPHNGLGDLTAIAQKLIAVNKKFSPLLKSKCVVIMGADHGIADEKVSSLARVTDTIAKNIMNGSSALSILAASSGCDIKVVDMGIKGDLKSCVSSDNFFSKFINKTGTKNFLKEPAMTKAECIESILTGIEIAEGLSHRYDIFGVGDIGIGNTTSAAALASSILNVDVDKGNLNSYLKSMAFHSKYREIIGFVNSSEIVSTDFYSSPFASIVDSQATITSGNRVTLYCWYDNEYGYSKQVINLTKKVANIALERLPKPIN